MVPVPVMIERTELAVKDLPRDDVYVKRVLKLMEKYSGNNKHLVYFFGDEDLYISLYANRIQVYPYNDWVQACFCPPVLGRIMAFDPHLKVGDYIYYDLHQIRHPQPRDQKDTFEEELLSKISKNFDLKVVEKDQTIVAAEIVGKRAD